MDFLAGIGKEALWGIIIIMGVVLMILLWEHVYIRAQLEFKQERYWWVLGASDMYIFEYDIIADELRLSTHFAAMLGITSHVFQFTKVIENSPKEKLERGLSTIAKILQSKTDDFTGRDIVQLRRADGTQGTYRVRCNSFRDQQGEVAYRTGIFVDVTKEIEEEAALRQRAEIDGLTGIYNAATVKFLVEEGIKTVKPERIGAFVMLDVDHFKSINDTYGHQVGDLVLKNLAKAIKKTVRATDIVGRLGGDEFCIFLSAIPHYEFLHEFCQRLNDVGRKCMNGADCAVNITISVGGIIVHDNESFTSVYKRADMALYEAKSRGRNTNCVSA